MTRALDNNSLAAHVLVALAKENGRATTLAAVAQSVGARRADVRAMVTRLHREGFVDALRMRTTLAGFALATAMSARLRDVRTAACEVALNRVA